MPSVPDVDEYVIASVKKIMPYGAFCSLDEYGAAEAFLHVSEVSSGWIRNIREYVKEGQKIVVKVIRLDSAKNQIDISLKRVTDADRKRKMQSATQENRAEKLLEHCAKKLKTTPDVAYKEAGKMLETEFGDLYAAFEAISQGQIPTSKVPANWLAVITEVAKQEIKEKTANVRYTLTIQSYDGKGITIIKGILAKIAAAVPADIKISMHYLGAPHYYIDAEAKDYKTLEKYFDKVEGILEDSAKGDVLEYSLDKAKAA